MSNANVQHEQSTDFGIFYPFGYIVAAFNRYEDAVKVRDDLLRGGYDPADCIVELNSTKSEAASKNLEENTGWIARLGRSDETLQLQLDAANDGATFLRIFAPHETDVERAMNVVRRVPFILAHRYQRFAIQYMK